MDILLRLILVRRMLCKQLVKLMLLGRNLKQQALAQVAGAHAGRVKLPHHFHATPQELEHCFSRRLRNLLGFAKGLRQLFFAAGQVPVLVQIADDELCRFVQAGPQGQRSNCHAR